MKELKLFRQFLTEGVKNQQVNENELPKGSPAMEKNEIQDFLSRQIPEEWPGSWTGDMTTGTFTAPYEHIMLATDQDDVEDYFYENEEMIGQLPTEWVKVDEFKTAPHNGVDYQVMNFAKYVPGEGVYVAATTDEIGGSVNEIADTNTGEIARDVFDIVVNQMPANNTQDQMSIIDAVDAATTKYLAGFPEDQAVSRSDKAQIAHMAMKKLGLSEGEQMNEVESSFEDILAQIRTLSAQGKLNMTRGEASQAVERAIRNGRNDFAKSQPDYAEKMAARKGKAAATKAASAEQSKQWKSEFAAQRQADAAARQARQDNNQLPLRYDTAFTDIESRIGDLARYYDKRGVGTDSEALILKPQFADRSFSDEVIAKAWLK